MIKTFTAEEFFSYIQSFEKMYVWCGLDGNSGVFVRANPKRAAIMKRKNGYEISCLISQKGESFYEESGLILYGNEFQCDIEKDCARYEVAVKSDKMSGSLKIVFTNIT